VIVAALDGGLACAALNHRCTTDPAVLDGMIARGWTMAGEAATRVFACVPVPERPRDRNVDQAIHAGAFHDQRASR
jgi:hypothetical protein